VNSLPLISVIMPVYNEERWLDQSISSILNQSFRDFEFIILNDASKDCSIDIINKYLSVDSRIKLFNNRENYGLVKTLNKGIDLARGKYIARMDADDVSFPERLNIQIRFLKQNPEIQFVGTGSEVTNDSGERLKTDNTKYVPPILVKWCLIFKNVFTHGSIMCQSEMLKKNSYAQWAANGEDYELWARLKDNYRMSIIPDILYRRRSHANNISHKNSKSLRKIGYTISNMQMERYLGKNYDKSLSGYLINCKLKKNRDFKSLVKAILLLNELLRRFIEANKLNVDEENTLLKWTRRYRLEIVRRQLLKTIFKI